MRKLTQWLAKHFASTTYAFERLNARLYDAPWRCTPDRAGRPC